MIINRTLVWQKVMAITYSCYQDPGKTPEIARKELRHAMDKAYDLYRYLLLLLVELRHYADLEVEVRRDREQRYAQPPEESPVDVALTRNLLLQQLDADQTLRSFLTREHKPNIWRVEGTFLKKLFDDISAWSDFRLHAALSGEDYEADKSIVARFYKKFIVGNRDIDKLLEETDIYWNDDKHIVDTFVIKTLRWAKPEKANLLISQYGDDKEELTLPFAEKLLQTALEHKEDIHRLISENSQDWDFSRLALMDVVVAHVCLAEIFAFPDIPVNVSLGEYIELAKFYSTPKSSSFVNGLLHHIVCTLREQQKITKP